MVIHISKACVFNAMFSGEHNKEPKDIAKKDSGPKHHTTAYILFTRSERPRLEQELRDNGVLEPNKEVIVALSEQWKQLPEHKKAEWYACAQKEREAGGVSGQ